MKHLFQNINLYCRNLDQEQGGAFVCTDQCNAQMIDERERASAKALSDMLL